MRETELWRRMGHALGSDYARAWADTVVLAALDGRTVVEALAQGARCQEVWRAVWQQLDLPEHDR